MNSDRKPTYEDFFNEGSPVYFEKAECFKEGAIPKQSLSTLLDLRDIDLKPLSRLIIEDSAKDEFVARLCQAIHAYTQFQDLMGVTFQGEKDIPRQLFNRNYCFHESLVYLREILRAWLDGNLIAATVLQRPFIELSIFHLYWQRKIDGGELTSYYEWLEGKGKKPHFASMLNEVVSYIESRHQVSPGRITRIKDVLKNFFGAHSAYNHTPMLSESLIRLNRGMGKHSHETFWKVPAELEIVVNQLVFLYVLAYPMSLFPVDILRKFGCGGPLNLFFDKTNFTILNAYIGDDNITGMKNDLSNNENVASLLEWYKGFPDKSDEEIWTDWNNRPVELKSFANPTDLNQMSAMLKAHKRSMCWTLTYKDFGYETNTEQDLSDDQISLLNGLLRDW